MNLNDWDLTKGPRREPYYDGSGSGLVRDIPSYITFEGDDLAYKSERMSEYIRELGDNFTEEKLVDFEAAINIEILGPHGGSKLLPHQPPIETASWGPLKPLGAYLYRLPLVEFEGAKWRSPDRPFLKLADRWILASDDELQWIIYNREDKARWRAVKFPTAKESLIRFLRDKEIPIPDTLATWPDHYSNWLREQSINK